MSQKKLDLLECATGEVAESSARAPEVARRELLDASPSWGCPDDIP